MGTLLQDLRFAVRLLTKSRGISSLAVLALALGIGANTAIFSLVNATLFRPLPGVEDPGRLAQFERLQGARVFYNFGFPDYLDYRNSNQTMSGLAAHVGTPMIFSGDSSTQVLSERVKGELVTGNYFSVLGVKPALGRLIDSDDDGSPGKHPVAVLSYGFWQRAFGGADVVGRSVSLNGHSFTIVGVAGREFGGTALALSIDVWMPMAMLAQGMPRTRSSGSGWFEERAWGWLGMFGRLKPGVTFEQAQAEMKTIARQLEQSYPVTNDGRSVQALSPIGLNSSDRAELGEFLGLLLAAVVLLLLISCGNAANLLLLRASARRREIAVRMALGASRGRLIRQLLTEGVLLSLAAGVLGFLLAPWASSVIAALQQPSSIFHSVEMNLDLRVLAFAIAVSMATGLLFGLFPALQASKADLVTSLKDGAASSTRRGSRLQNALVISQIALSLVLLIGAGLVVKTMRTILTADPGFDRENMLLMSVDLSIQEYAEQQGKSFYDQITRRLEALPGVMSASLAKTVPPNSWSDRLSIFYPGEEPPDDVLRGRDDQVGLRVELNRIAPDYFRTLGITILQGREFNGADSDGAAGAAVVNEKLANRLWPGENAIGKRVSVPLLRTPRPPPFEVVGVVTDTRHRSMLVEPPLILYVPEQQAYDGRATIVVRTAGDPKSLIPAIRGEVAALDKSLPLTAVKTMSEQVSSTLWQQQMAAGLIGIFGLLALLLAAIGLYGVIAQFVAQRNREIAIRMALGASAAEVVQLVLKQGSTLAVAGVGAGIVIAYLSTRVLSSLLWNVSATDPATFVVAASVLIVVPVLASIIPARRASRIDPVVALRQE